MKIIFYVFFILLLINNNNLFCQDYVVTSDHKSIKINGNIILKQFYGPPNYGETPEVDIIESYYVLKLNESFSFSDEKNMITVEEIQLILDINNIGNVNSNCDYLVVGKAFFAEIGHHHTPVIILVDMIILNKYPEILFGM